MSGTADQPSLRADARANHQALLSAAGELFAERGIDVSYEEIAERAGVGRATLYRHFPTKDDLLADLLGALLDELESAATRLGARPDGLLALFDFCVRAQHRHLPIIDLATQRASTAEIRTTRARFEQMLAGPLANSQAAGSVAAQLTVGDVRLLLLMLSSLNRNSVSDAERARGAQLARAALTGALE